MIEQFEKAYQRACDIKIDSFPEEQKEIIENFKKTYELLSRVYNEEYHCPECGHANYADEDADGYVIACSGCGKKSKLSIEKLLYIKAKSATCLNGDGDHEFRREGRRFTTRCIYCNQVKFSCPKCESGNIKSIRGLLTQRECLDCGCKNTDWP